MPYIQKHIHSFCNSPFPTIVTYSTELDGHILEAKLGLMDCSISLRCETDMLLIQMRLSIQ